MKKVLGTVALAMAGLFAFTGCGEKAAETVKIGAIGPLSGAVAVYGVDCLNGINLAAEEINAAGGINGKKIEIISEDDEGAPEKSVNAYKKIVTKDKAKLIIGSLTSGCTKAITSLAQAQKVLMIAPAATDPSITTAGDYVFRACFIDPFQGTVGAKLPSKLSVQRKLQFFMMLETTILLVLQKTLKKLLLLVVQLLQKNLTAQATRILMLSLQRLRMQILMLFTSLITTEQLL